MVLGLMALALALVAPNMGSVVRRMELTAVQRELLGALRYTRGRAIATGKPADFWLDLNGHVYRAGNDDKIRHLPNWLRFRLSTAQTQTTRDGKGYIRFFPDGASSGGHIIADTEGAAFRVNVNWLTGEAELADPVSGQ